MMLTPRPWLTIALMIKDVLRLHRDPHRHLLLEEELIEDASRAPAFAKAAGSGEAPGPFRVWFTSRDDAVAAAIRAWAFLANPILGAAARRLHRGRVGLEQDGGARPQDRQRGLHGVIRVGLAMRLAP